MMTDTPESVTLVPIDRIEVLYPRDRNMKVFEEIVDNIRSIGLKKPVTVTEREGFDGAPAYLLVWGEGRLNAFRLLGESYIPALEVTVTDEDAFIMSLAENIGGATVRWRSWPTSSCCWRGITPSTTPFSARGFLRNTSGTSSFFWKKAKSA